VSYGKVSHEGNCLAIMFYHINQRECGVEPGVRQAFVFQVMDFHESLQGKCSRAKFASAGIKGALRSPSLSFPPPSL
jgi:hypothetical protein